MSHTLPERVREFLLAHVDSIELLEVLLLLAARPDSALSAEEVSDELRTAPSSAARRLGSLEARQLVQSADGERFQVRPGAELAETLRQVRQAYRDWRVTVVAIIYSRPSGLVRRFTA